jgi:hypothetical protein
MGDVLTDGEWRCVGFVRHPADDGHELFYFPLSRRAHVLPSSTASLLEGCRTFRSLEEHAAMLSRRSGLDQAEMLRSLEQLATLGGLSERSQLVSACRRATTLTSRIAADRVTTLGIPTRDRPALLARAVRSYVANLEQFGRRVHLVVLDDSRRDSNRNRNAEFLATVARGRTVTVKHISMGQRLAFVSQIARRADLPGELVRFGLMGSAEFRCSPGAARNCLLLQTLGELLVQVDDDTECDIATVPGTKPGLACSSAAPMNHWLFPDAPSVRAFVRREARDFLGTHEQLLGRTLRACVDDAADGIDVGAIGTDFIQKLSHAGEGIVRTTALGIYGDAAMGFPYAHLFLPADARKRLAVAEDEYRALVTSRQTVRLPLRRTITTGVFCMATNLGLDNRRSLPPFLPVMTNEDGVFGLLLNRSCPEAYGGFLPWAIAHGSAKTSASRQSRAAAVPSDGELVAHIVASLTPGVGSFESRMGMLGAQLRELGRLAAPEFEDILGTQERTFMAQQLRVLDAGRSAWSDAPAHWIEDVRRYSEALRRGIDARVWRKPHGLPGRGLDSLQMVLFQFGSLLSAWPAIVGAARELR